MEPLILIKAWLQDEKALGAPNPQQAVLSTIAERTYPHARVVAISEITEKGVLFFTQKGTRKVSEIECCPHGVITFWLELKQRQIIIEGVLERLSDEENQCYWLDYPREAKLRFHTYAPISTQPITDKTLLDERKASITTQYENHEVPISPFYCGYRLKPTRFAFYEYLITTLSNSFEYKIVDDQWLKQALAP